MSEEIRNYINHLFQNEKITLEEFCRLHELVTITVCNVLTEKENENNRTI